MELGPDYQSTVELDSADLIRAVNPRGRDPVALNCTYGQLVEECRNLVQPVPYHNHINVFVCRRHRCPHKTASNESPLDLDRSVPISALTSQHEHFHPFEPEQVREVRPKLQRLHTQLTLPDGTLETVSSYQAEFEEKKGVRQSQ